MSYVSSLNYPGGVAMELLHRAEPPGMINASVHLSNLACQTGVSRFAQVNDGGWSYDKTEGLDFAGKAAYRSVSARVTIQTHRVDSFAG